MANTSGAAISLVGPFLSQAGMKLARINVSEAASVSSFSVTVPFDTSLFAAVGIAANPANATEVFAWCNSSANTDGSLSILGDGTVTFTKNSSNAQKITVLLLGV